MIVRAILIEGEASPEALAALRAALESVGVEEMPTPVRRPTVRDVMARVSFEMGVPVVDITGRGQGKPALRARAAISWIAGLVCGSSLAEIGRALGGRDHTTVIHQRRRAEQMRGTDPAFRRVTNRLLAEFGGGAA
jgi:chromosomal replication initiation ATPase DnaA